MHWIALWLAVASGLTHSTPATLNVSAIRSVYDGDTFRVDIEGWPPLAGHNMPIRVLGIDTPEIRGKCESEKVAAKSARDFAKTHLLSAKRVTLTNVKRGKYFRLLATVLIDGQSLADLMILNGYARPYAGGTREGWCPTPTSLTAPEPSGEI